MFVYREFCVCLVALLAMATDTSSSDISKQLSAGNSKFTSAFFDILRSTDGNLFFSPISIEALLALAHAGAGGKTAVQLQQAAHLPETKEMSAKLYGELMETFKNDGNVTLSLANALFADKEFKIKPDFLDIAKNGFKAEASVVDFGAAQQAADTINNYVAKVTNNKISGLFDASAFDAMTKLVLLNAIYFKGDWADKFAVSDTKKGTFHLNEKDHKEVDFMQIKKKLNVARNEELDAQILELPYKGNSVSMIIVVPNTVNGLSKIESKIASTDLNQLMKLRYQREVILKMPKFKLEHTIELNDLLIKLGIEDLFSESKADLSGIADQPLFASKAMQKAYIEVNEEGSEAAAVTGLKIQMRMMPLPPLKIVADSPFLFFIRSEDLTLFVGRVSNPSAN